MANDFLKIFSDGWGNLDWQSLPTISLTIIDRLKQSFAAAIQSLVFRNISASIAARIAVSSLIPARASFA